VTFNLDSIMILVRAYLMVLCVAVSWIGGTTRTSHEALEKILKFWIVATCIAGSILAAGLGMIPG